MAESKLAGPIGLPLDRVDGHLKVTGRATYAYEYAAQGSAAYGFIVSAAIGKGRILEVDASDAAARPRRAARLDQRQCAAPKPRGARSTCRTALPAPSPRSIPTRCSISASPSPSWSPTRSSKPPPPPRWSVSAMSHWPASTIYMRLRLTRLTHTASVASMPADSAIGDFESAFANAPMKIDAIYTTPYQHQAPMEPHATMAVWDGQMLTVHMSAQLTTSPQEGLARTFNIPKENVRVITRYVGGGFGSKLPYYVDATLAAIGARMLRRPVKVAMTRPQVFHTTTHRTASEQHLRLGADRDGRLTAYGQDALVHCARFDIFTEPVCECSPHAICRAQPTDPASPRKAGSAAVGFDAGAGRRDRPASARMRDGRVGRGPRSRSGRAAPAQRYPDRSRAEPALLLAPSRRGVARGCCPLRLGQARSKAGQRPRRALACRSRRRLGDPRATYCRARRRVRAWRAMAG